MNTRVQVTEDQWVGGLTEADYVVLDLGRSIQRPWLDAARERVELVGRATGPADEAMLAHALELDVDFLALTTPGEGLDARRLPLRLIVEQGVGESADFLGAAWARQIGGWALDDEATLSGLARRERIFLAAPGQLPEMDWIRRVAPFAIAAPAQCDPAVIARIRGS